MKKVPQKLKDAVITATGLPDNVVAFTTLRSFPDHTDFNLGIAENADVGLRNRQWLEALLPAKIPWLQQSHSTKVIDSADAFANPHADATICFKPNAPCAVLTADCLPLVLASEDGKACATVHAGWRGLANGIINNTYKELKEKYPATYLAWLGPAISQSFFQVGAEVREAFLAHGFPASAFLPDPANDSETLRYYGDLYALARYALQTLGVVSVSGGEHCTYSEDTAFFSHRRNTHKNDQSYGRMATIAYLLS